MSTMQSIEAIATKGSRELMEKYGKKFGYDDDQIAMFFEVMDTIKVILDSKVRPNIQDWDRTGAKLVDGKVVLPPKYEDVLNEIIRDNELYSWFVPEEFGGFGYSGIFQTGLNELMAQYDISLQVSTTISLSVLEALIVYHNEHFDPIIKKYMKGEHTGYVAFTEPQAGSNLQKIKSTSVLDGDEYILNGTKIFISNGGYATAGLFLANNVVDGKVEGSNVFIVEGLEGITTLRLEEKSGLHSNPTAQLLFEDVRVPKENIIATVGNGYRKVLERLLGMRVGVSCQGIGASIRAYELATNYAEERHQFGKPIGSFDGVSRKLKEMERQIPRMREYGYLAAHSLDRYYKGWVPLEVGASGDASEKTAAEMLPSPVRMGLIHYTVSAAKMYISETTNSLLYDAQQIFGGNGFIAEYEVNKIARDVRVLPIYEGTSEIHEWIIGRSQQAINMIPKFKKVSDSFDSSTVYERVLNERFPGIMDKI